MKFKTTPLFFLISLMILSMTANTPAATVGVEATTIKQFGLDKTPLDVVTAPDGKLTFILVPGEILIYANLESEPVNRVTVEGHFDGLAFAQELDLLILTSNTGKQVKLVRIDLVNDISTDGSPIKGNPEAPVTIAVFDDYQ